MEREGVLELALPRGVGPEGVALGGLARGVQLDQLGGDLADRLAGPALALGPVGAAEPVEAGLLAADVAGHLVEAVGRHEEPVGRPAALGGAVLEDEVLAGGALHLALPHLDEPADAVLLVDDVVAGLELQRVDLPLAPRRHPALVAGGGALAGEVVAGEQDQADGRRRRSRGPGPPVVTVTSPASSGASSSGSTSRAATSCSPSTSTIRWAGPCAGVDHDDAMAVGQPAADVGDGTLEVAAVALDRDGAEGPHAGALEPVGQLGVEAERADRPPGMPELAAVGADVVELAVGRGAEVDRRRAAACGGRPGRAQELLAGGDQVVGAAADPLGVEHQRPGCRRASGRRAAPSRRRAPGASDSIPSTAMPGRDLRRSSRPAAGAPRRARPRGGVRRRSAAARGTAAPTAAPAARCVRWSATANERISSTSSPQNSTRTGCSSVGGKTSTMPPRTANSPRFSTRSTRVYAASASRRTTSSSGDGVARARARRARGRRAPAPGAAASTGPARPRRVARPVPAPAPG